MAEFSTSTNKKLHNSYTEGNHCGFFLLVRLFIDNLGYYTKGTQTNLDNYLGYVISGVEHPKVD